MKQILVKSGQAFVLDVPIPKISDDEILVNIQKSCLSIGTEVSSVKGSATPIWKKEAISHPDKIFQALNYAKENGLKNTIDYINDKKNVEYPMGYSASGIIVDQGSDIKDFKIGDRVACAGGQYAYHAEYIRITKNMCIQMRIMFLLKMLHHVTLGAIALQGVRRLNPTIGETFTVIGLGILGQLTVQILLSNGCNVIGIDTLKRIDLASSFGMDHGFMASEINEQVIEKLTDGYGTDGVIITAAI